jgi:hypothetical protein
MNQKQQLFWAQAMGLLKQTMNCTYCEELMTQCECKNSTDGFKWQCRNSSCSHRYTYKNVRTNCCFKNFNLKLVTLLKVLYYWSKGFQQHEILSVVNVSRHFLVKFENFLSNQIKKYFLLHPVKLGGMNRVCQIDETMLNFKVKSHVGRGPREKIWCFGIVDPTFSPALGYCCVVPNRTTQTLFEIIRNVCLEGTTIISDEWPAYTRIQESLSFNHFKVCHKENFIDPVTRRNTQNVESYWNKLKLAIKK